MQKKVRKVGIYVRVSTQEQAKEGYSIPTQIKLLEAFCDSQGWDKREVYADPGQSAKDTNRPDLQRLKKDIQKGEIDVLLVYRLDRLTRSVRDLFDILQFLEESNCAFRSATENYDTTSAMGRMFIGLVGLMAQWERENIGERVSVVMKEKALIGGITGRQPYGFKIDGDKRVVDEDEKEVILMMIDIFKRHKSMIAVAQELNRMNIPTKTKTTTWSHQTIRQLLRNPALYGTVEYDGETAEGVHEGIITKEEFEELSRRIEKQNLVRVKAPTRGLFSGIIRCPQCDRTLVKASNKYRCNKCYENGKGLLRVDENDIEEAFLSYINDLSVEDVPEPENNKPKRDIQKEIEKLEQRRIKFQRMYADDFMTYEEFQKNMKQNKMDMDRLKLELEEQSDDLDFEQIKNMVLSIRDNYENLTREERIDFMAIFVKDIYFTRKVVKVDKNGTPRKYAYKITEVKYNRL